MTVFICIVLLIVFGFYVLHQLDQQRWKRYKLERDLYFRKNPYVFKGNQAFNISICLAKSAQTKLLNALMINSDHSVLYKKLCLRHENQQRLNRILVILDDFTLAVLEPYYAEKISKYLEHTDFFVGRPIEVLAEISIVCVSGRVSGCKLKLDLPMDPQQILVGLFDPSAASKNINKAP